MTQIIVIETTDRELLAEVRQAVEKAQRREQKIAEWAAVLTSEEGLAHWAKIHGWHKVPIARALVYGDREIEFEQEMHPNRGGPDIFNYGHFDLKDPRRPVIMRGARELLVARYAAGRKDIPNIWVSMVVARYLRRMHYTCSDPQLHYVAMRKLQRRPLYQKFHVSSEKSGGDIIRGYDFFVGENAPGERGHWSEGRHFRVEPSAVLREPQKAAAVFGNPEPPPEAVLAGRKPKRRAIDRQRVITRAVKELGLVNGKEKTT
jgi:hypothetical protein